MASTSHFYIILDNKSPIEFTIWDEWFNDDSILEIDAAEAYENGEAEIQIKEGLSYEYELQLGYSLVTHELVRQSRSANKSSGRIIPNIYVGRLNIDIEDSEHQKCGTLSLEVRSVKTQYREDYRTMLEEITEKCTDLILLHSSPVTQYLESDFDKDPATLYQRFTFIKSILESEEFSDAVHKIVSGPVTKWISFETERDIRNIKKFDNQAVRQLSGRSNRIGLPESHILNQRGILRSVPQKINSFNKKESIDTPENRFVKYALESFLERISKIRIHPNIRGRLKNEAAVLEDQLEQMLGHSMFKEVSRLNILPLNSPVLQRKEGYREVLRVWLMFDLAARLVWKGGDDVYSAGKRDVAKLYEYWLFFKLLDIVKEVFNVESEELKKLIEYTADDLGLHLKEGNHVAIHGVFKNNIRNLNVEFSFNRSFSGKKEYPSSGSWTKSMRPDYTLSIWPEAITQEAAEKEELIVHIHFDAKYKVERLSELFDDNEDMETDEESLQLNLNKEKAEETKGNFKRIDLLKMHAYKDAIRRTGGAYVLYPGKNDQPYLQKGFHEILPGLGAFAIRPDKTNDGSLELKEFLNEVTNHFLNRASQREKVAYRTYDIHKDVSGNEVLEPLPEAYGINRSLMPDETFVLIAYYKNEKHLQWILNTELYNTRTGSIKGSLNLSPDKVGAKYILLHGEGETKTGRLKKISGSGPRIFSKQNMIDKHYPEPNQDYYLIYNISDSIESEFENMKWDITKLEAYKKGRGSALTFSVSLSDLMKSIVK